MHISSALFVCLFFSFRVQITPFNVLDQNWRGLTKIENLPGRGTGVFTQLPVPSGRVLCNYEGELHSFSSKTAAEDFINTLPSTDYTFTVSIMFSLLCYLGSCQFCALLIPRSISPSLPLLVSFTLHFSYSQSYPSIL